MSTMMQPQSSNTQLARPLKVIVPMIREQTQEAEQASIPHYAAAGLLLWEAKTHFEGESRKFYEWTRTTFNVSESTVKNWMTYATETYGTQVYNFQQDNSGQPANVSQPKQFKTLSEVTSPKRESHHGPVWYTPVQQITDQLNVTRMVQEQQDKAKETKLQRELGLQLIDIGYKVLATKLHPDKVGGSREAMARLNRVRDILKGAI